MADRNIAFTDLELSGIIKVSIRGYLLDKSELVEVYNMLRFNKALKVIRNILLILMGIIVIGMGVMFIVHHNMISNERAMLEDNGYINLVSAGDYNLNVYCYGADNPEHTLVGISGLGVNDFSIGMKYSLNGLKQDNRIVFIDRAGYGYSDDTKTKQSVEQVVSDYRTALSNVGVKPPYVLMPHSYGGVYATYWESMYPDEIEGAIFIDTSELGIDVWDENEYSVGMAEQFEVFLCKFGLQRFVLRDYCYELNSLYSEDDQKVSDSLNIYSLATNAKLSEMSGMNENTYKAYNSIIANNIPKIYISANSGFTTEEEAKEYSKWLQNRQVEVGLEISKTPSIYDKFLSSCEEWRNSKIKPYIDKLGNTELVLLPGDHMIFEQRPDDLTKVIKEYLESFDD